MAPLSGQLAQLDEPYDLAVSVLDPAALNRLDEVAQRDPTLLPRLVELYLADTPDRLQALRAAVERQDAAAVRAVAHALRGSSETFGAHEMVGHCEFLEYMPPEWDGPRIDAHLTGLIEAYGRTRAALQRMVAAKEP